eukprot:s917_g28.t1
MRSPAAWYCDLCGQSWELCHGQPRSGARPSQRRPAQRKPQWNSYEDHWEDYDWDGYQTGSESPRRAQQPHNRRAPAQKRPKVPQQEKGNKGNKGTKGDGKGQGKSTYKGKYNIDPPPWSSQTATTPAATATTATSAASSKAEAKLQEIVTAMQKKKDTLDPELQTLAQEAEVLQTQNATSKLMSAVSKHGDAKTAVLDAKQARSNLHATWKQYLDSAITTWKGFIEDFDKTKRRRTLPTPKAFGCCQDGSHGEGIARASGSHRRRQHGLCGQNHWPCSERGTLRYAQRFGEAAREDRRSHRRFEKTKTVRWHLKAFQYCWCLTAFCPGRSPDIHVGDLGPSASNEAVLSSLLKWNHSILREKTFTSKWQAITNGLDLAFEVDSWTTFGSPDEDSGPIQLTLSSYFIDHHHHRHHEHARILRLVDDYRQWEHEIRQVWADWIDAALPFDVVLVHPAPPAMAISGTVATAIVHQRLQPDRAACLTTAVVVDHPRPRYIEIAHSFPRLMMPSAIIQAAEVEPLCQQRLAQGYGACRLLVGLQDLLPDQFVPIIHGQGFVIRVPPEMTQEELEHNLADRLRRQRAARAPHAWDDEQDDPPGPPEQAHPAPAPPEHGEEPEDVTSFMARSALPSWSPIADSTMDSSSVVGSSSSSGITGNDEWRLPVVFCLDGRHVQFDAPWDDADRLWDIAATHFAIASTDVIRLFHVGTRPEDLVQDELECLLLQRRQDNPPVDFMRLTLIDVEYKADRRGPATHLSRYSKWLPRRITRSSLIRMVGYDGHCALRPDRCDVWLNGHYADFAVDIMHITNGDYVKIAIPEDPDNPDCTSPSLPASNDTIESPEDLLTDDPSLFQHAAPDLLESDALNTQPFSCNLENNSVVPGPSYTHPLHPTPEVGRPEIQLGHHEHCFHSLSSTWSHHAAVELEEEGPVLYISTWYSDPTRWPQCRASRPVRLLQNFHEWADRIAEAWDDRVDPDALLHIYLLTPQPRQNLWDNSVQPHVLLVQHPVETLRSIHFSVLDTLHIASGVRQIVDILPAHTDTNQILHALHLNELCHPHSETDCMIWFGDIDLRRDHHLQLRDGNSLFVIYNQLAAEGISDAATGSADPLPARLGHPLQESDSDGSVSLLQIHSSRARTVLKLDALIHSDGGPSGQERLTDVTVAHAHRPCPTCPTRAISVYSCPPANPPCPDYLEIPNAGTNDDVQLALRSWGHAHTTHLIEEADIALSLPPMDTESFLHVYLAHGPGGVCGPYWQAIPTQHLDHVAHMRFLHSQGHPRAVILSQTSLPRAGTLVIFADSQGTIAATATQSRPTPAWPAPMPSGTNESMFPPPQHAAHPDKSCWLATGVTADDLHQLFNCSHGSLHTSFDDLHLDPDLLGFLQRLPLLQGQEPDRYIVYVDGSSQGPQKHRPIEWIEEHGLSDAWAMLALAEIYATSTIPSQLFVVGWTAQQVRYSSSSPFYLGSSRTSSLTAEREGLTWAFLWRLGINCRTPTLFRSDSLLSCQQAIGSMGTAEIDDTFLCLRGAYQILETALPHGHVEVEHIHGHSNEPFNDFTDFAAKQESSSSYYLPRFKINMELWRKRLPHLWMLFGNDIGCPYFHGDGFAIAPPALPASRTSTSTCDFTSSIANVKPVQLTISLCTANVLSMCSAPDGFAGKLGYLVEQFQAHALLFGGIQEARTPQGSCRCHNIHRFCSGAHKGGGGVELWLNLKQPYGYIEKKPLFLKPQHLQILEATPRTLIGRLSAPYLDAFLVAAHAPHSGKPEAERHAWWATFAAQLHEHCGTAPLYVMIDANAAPGDADGHRILEPGLPCSRSTPLWRAFDLTLPQTSSGHTGGLHTWTSPDGRHGHCLDYVAIPMSQLPWCTHSQLLTHFDLSSEQIDHVPLAIELQWTLRVTDTMQPQRPATVRYDRGAIRQSPAAPFLLDLPPISWHADVETQVGNVNAHVLRYLQDHCPARRGGPKKTFITEAIWQMRKEKLTCRQALKASRRAQAHNVHHLAFRLWRHDPAHTDFVDEAFNYGTTLLCGTLKRFAEFRMLSKKLKQALKTAKHQCVADQLRTLPPDPSASSILHVLRPLLGSSNLKTQGPAPLPQIRNENGHFCPSPEEALDRWIAFFCTMEGGRRVDADQQRQLWLDNLRSLQSSRLDLEVTMIPSLTELEAAFRQVANGKATGPDNIPAEICNRYPARLAKHTYPLLLKILFHGHEPLEHKGGRLVPIWKRKLSQTQCAAYRSILISSHVGKCLHRTLRLHQATVYEQFLLRQQIGGCRRAPVTLGVHVARAYLRHQKVQNKPAALIFLDLSEAFYRVIRPLALPGHCTDDALAIIAARLGLGPTILEDLRQHLREPAATTRIAASSEQGIASLA